MLQIIFIWLELLVQIYAEPGTETHQGIPAYFLMEDHSPSLHVKVDMKGSKIVANPAGMFVTTESRIFQEHHLHGSGTSRSGVARQKSKAVRPRNGTDNAVTRSLGTKHNATINITSIFKTKLSEKSHRHTLGRKTALNHHRKFLINTEAALRNSSIQKTSIFKTKLSEKSHRHTLGRKTALNHRRKFLTNNEAAFNKSNSGNNLTQKTSIFKTKLSEKSHRHTLSRKTASNHRQKNLIKTEAALNKSNSGNSSIQKTSIFKTKLSEKSHRHTLGRKTALNHRRKTEMSKAALSNDTQANTTSEEEHGLRRNTRTIFESGSNDVTNGNHEYKYSEANLATLLDRLPERNNLLGGHSQQVRSNLNEYDNTVNNVETPIHDASRSQLMLLPHHNEYAPATPLYAPMQRKSAAPSARLFNITKSVKVNTPPGGGGSAASNKTLADGEPSVDDIEKMVAGVANDDDRMMELEENQSLLDPKTSIKGDSITSTWSNSVIDDSAKQRNTHPASINTEDELINTKFYGNNTRTYGANKDGSLKSSKDGGSAKSGRKVPIKSESSAITKELKNKLKVDENSNTKNDSTTPPDDSLMQLAQGAKSFDPSSNSNSTDNLFDMFKVTNNSVPKLHDHDVINTSDGEKIDDGNLNSDIGDKKNTTVNRIADTSKQSSNATSSSAPTADQKADQKLKAGNSDTEAVNFSGNNASVSSYTSDFKESRNGQIERVNEIINFNIDVNLPKEKSVKMITGVSTDGSVPQARNVTQSAEVTDTEKSKESKPETASASGISDNAATVSNVKLTTSEKSPVVKNETTPDVKQEKDKEKTANETVSVSNPSNETTPAAPVQESETAPVTKPSGENAPVTKPSGEDAPVTKPSGENTSTANPSNNTVPAVKVDNETIHDAKPVVIAQEATKNNGTVTTDSNSPTSDAKETIKSPNETATVNNQTATPSNATLVVRERKFNATKAVIADVLDAVKEELFLRLHSTGTLKSKNHTLERVSDITGNQTSAVAAAVEPKTHKVESKSADSAKLNESSSVHSSSSNVTDKLNAEIFIRSNETFSKVNETMALSNSSNNNNSTSDSAHNEPASAPLSAGNSSTHENATARESDLKSRDQPARESDQALWDDEMHNGGGEGGESKDANPKPVKINTDPAADNFYGHDNLMEPINDGGYSPSDYSNAQLDYHTDPVYYQVDTGGGLAYNHMEIPPHYRRG